MMKHLFFVGGALAAALAVSGVARAQSVIVIPPAQPTIVVQPAQPMIVVQQPPQPAVVVQQPAPAQASSTVVVQQPATSAPVAQQPAPVATQGPAASERRTCLMGQRWRQGACDYLARPPVRQGVLGLGLRTHFNRTGERELTFFGGGGVFRLIPGSRLGLELTFEVAGDEEHRQIPIELSNLVFFNVRGRLQPYLLAGFNFTAERRGEQDVTFLYTGGHAGVGVELLIGRRLGVTLDTRSYYRRQLSSETEESDYGVTVNAGFNLYLSRPGSRHRGAGWRGHR